jgi:hypothetical protein
VTRKLRKGIHTVVTVQPGETLVLTGPTTIQKLILKGDATLDQNGHTLSTGTIIRGA